MSIKRDINFIRKGYSQKFSITMTNYNLDMGTGKEYTSELKSDYSRCIYEIPKENLGFAKYKVYNTYYRANEKSEDKRWSFAANAEFYHCLYTLSDKAIKEEYYKESETVKPYPTLEESFSKYPKLPSVYLLVMQVMDIISIDSFLSLINSNCINSEISTEYVKISELSNKNISIGAGIYSENSYYYNSDFYIRFVGKGKHNNRECWLVDYYAEPSEVYMEQIYNKNSKKNKSLYSGCIYISTDEGEVIYAEMKEDVIPIGNSRKFVKRKIRLNNEGE